MISGLAEQTAPAARAAAGVAQGRNPRYPRSRPNHDQLQIQLGTNNRAMVYAWRLRPGVALASVTLETLSQEAIIGLVGVTIMNLR